MIVKIDGKKSAEELDTFADAWQRRSWRGAESGYCG